MQLRIACHTERPAVATAAPADPSCAQHGTTFKDPDGVRVVLLAAQWPS